MKESYVLKRRNGEACGYVMARDKEVRVRLPNEKRTAKMAVIYADQTQTLEGMLDGLERTYPAAGTIFSAGFKAVPMTDKLNRLLGAYVCSGGRLLMDTGEAARRAFERAEEACQSAQRPEGKRKDARGEDVRTHARRQTEGDTIEAAECRWPPPPCMPGARYVNGAWKVSQGAVR